VSAFRRAYIIVSLSDITHADITEYELGPISSLQQRRDSPSSIAKPVRPLEFSLWLAIPVTGLFLILAILLGVVYEKARANGMFRGLRGPT
jgi:hypothetical protein